MPSVEHLVGLPLTINARGKRRKVGHITEAQIGEQGLWVTAVLDDDDVEALLWRSASEDAVEADRG